MVTTYEGKITKLRDKGGEGQVSNVAYFGLGRRIPPSRSLRPLVSDRSVTLVSPPRATRQATAGVHTLHPVLPTLPAVCNFSGHCAVPLCHGGRMYY
jgi:hypothetical protein